MAKNLNVNLSFTAQTGQAKAQIQELQLALNKVALSSANLMPGVNEQQFQKAANAAKQLAIHLNSAYNANTGKLDLSLLNKSLLSAKTNIGSLSSDLLQAGSSGQTAFASLASAISQAERPILRLNSSLGQMWTVLKNTARWQLSSTAIHGFMSTVQGAYRYTQDLNESLNNIRIVTGASVEEMAAFADQANKAAKALSTTTTEYTNASLIYYQQGLNDQQVKERTDATIKMANVSRQSAETVSDQMTAIWNNFDDGSKSLEYYGDVITELGAKTASSSEEIAAGLEKFAAVSETIGLSYEYATAALATVTATTRQSADVVGTAFKTIFTRLQGLNLGETLDDGVTLNKYSEALAKVGVNAIDANGNLVEMDTILSQLGERWDTLSKAEQTALAQTVAGVRQYTQLVALMDNWDFFGENLEAAYDSEGTLNEQAEIYAESWEAAADRATAAAESIYSSLLDDKFFIKTYDGFAQILTGINSFIEGAGGIKSVLIAIGATFLSSVSGKIGPALQNLKHNFTVVFQTAQQQANAVAGELNQTIRQVLDSNSRLPAAEQMNIITQASLQNTLALNTARSQLAVVTKDLTATEMAQAEQQIYTIETYAAEVNAIAEKISALEQERSILSETVAISASDKIENIKFSQTNSNIPLIRDASNELNQYINTIALAGKENINFGSTFSKTIANIEQLGKATSLTKTDMQGVGKLIAEIFGKNHSIVTKYNNLLTQSHNKVGKWRDVLNTLTSDMRKQEITTKEAAKWLNQYGEDGRSLASKINTLINSYKQLEVAQQRVNEAANNFNVGHTITGIEKIASLAAAAGKIATVSFGIQSISKALTDVDATPLERLTSGLMGISMVIPGLLGAFKSLDVAMGKNISLSLAAMAADKTLTVSKIKLIGTEESLGSIEKIANDLIDKKISLLNAEAIATEINTITEKKNLTEDQKAALIQGLLAIGLKKKAEGEYKAAAGTLSHWIAQKLANSEMKIGLALLILQAAKLAGVAIAITAVVAVAVALYRAYNQANIEAKKAEEAAASLAEKYENVKSEVEGIKSAFEEYDSVVEKLNECTVGTEEWKAALEEVNDIIKGIIVDYPDLVKDIEFGYREDGSRYIANADEIIANADKKLATAEMQSVSANLIAEQKRYDSNGVDWERSIPTFGVMTDAEMEPDDVVAEKVLDSYLDISDIMLDNKEKIEEGLKNALTLEDKKELYGEIASKVLSAKGLSQNDIEYNLEPLTEALLNASDSFAETVINAGNDVSAAFENSMNIMADSNLDNEKYSAAEREIGSEYLEEYIKTETDNILDNIDEDTRAWNGRTNKKTEKVWQRYLNAIDEEYTLASNAIKGHGKNASYQYLDESGDKKEVSLQEMAAAIAAAEALEGLGVAADGAKAALESIGNDFKENGIFEKSDIENYIASGNLESLTQEEYEALSGKKYEDWIGLDNLQKLAQAELGITGDYDSLSSEDQKKVNAKMDEMEAAFVKATSSIDYDSIGREFFTGLASIFKGLKEEADGEFMKQFNVSEQETIANALSQTYSALGAKGATSLSEILKNAGENANELAEIITTIDWDNATPEDIASALEEAGIEVSVLGDNWDIFVASMSAASKTIYTLVEALESLRNQIASIKEIAGEIEFGDVISDEDYDTLLSYSKEIANLFTQTYDGWKFVGDAKELNSILEGTTKSLEEVKKEYEDADIAGTRFFKAHEDEWTDEEGNFHVGGEGADIHEKANALGVVMTEFSGSDSPILDILPDPDVLQEAMSRVSKGINDGASEEEKAIYDNAVAMVESAHGSLQQLMDDWMAGKFESQVAEELWVNSYVESLNELESAFNSGKMSAETYAKTFDSVFQKEAVAEGFDYEEVLAYADALQDTNEATIKSTQEAKRLALAHAKMNRGLSNLADNWDDWSKAMKSDDLTKKSKALSGLRDVMSDLTGTDMSSLPASFFESATNAELLEKAVAGDVDAINELTAAAAKKIILTMGLDTSTTSELQSLVDDALAMVDAGELTVGMSLNDAQMYDAFQSLLDSGAVTVDQMNAILSGIGFEPVVETKKVELASEPYSMNGSTWVDVIDPRTGEKTRVFGEYAAAGQAIGQLIEIPAINGEATVHRGGGSSASKPSSSGGGGGGGAKTRDRTKKPTENRYHDLNDTLDDIAESLKDINRELDMAYGKSRIQAIEKMIEALEDEKAVLEDKLAANVEYVEDDKALLEARLDEGQRKLGITNTIVFDENGNLDNWESYINSAYDELNRLEDIYNGLSASEQESFLEETLEPYEKWLEAVEEAGSQYEESIEEQEDIIQEIKDLMIEIMEANYDKWETQFDMLEELTDDALNQLERTLEHFADSFFARAEKAEMMKGITDIYNTGHANQGWDLFNDLTAQYNAGQITIADYIEGMKQVQEFAEDSIDQLYEYMDQMSTYYADTVEMSLDIINGVIDQFDHFQSVLDHYANIYEVIEGTVDYEAQLDILNARKDMLMQEGESVREAYDMYKREREREEEEFIAAQAAWDAVKDSDPESIEYKIAYENFKEAKNSYEEVLAAEQELQEQLLANAEEYAETIREIFVTEVEMFGEQMEKESLKLLDNVHSFDQLNEQIEQAKSLTEDWLTETNKIYETNKLINTAQGALEKTENSLAKNKLSAFIKETEQLQNQSKLSNFELEVQQKKYDLLLAEIALEEARNAKSTVRMRRDSEGNIGYVYTADQDAINDAEQDLADAENELYNLRLEGANEFAEKRLQAEQDYQEKLKELWNLCYVENQISEEEYNARVEALTESHYELMEGYAHIYNEAIRYDTRVTADAWSTDYKDMVLDTESWKDYTEQYLGEVTDAYERYQSDVDWLNEQINTSNDGVARNIRDNLNQAINETTQASQALGDYVKDNLVPALEKELTAVDNVADEFRDELIPQIYAAITAYQLLAAEALAAKQAAMNANQQEPEVEVPQADGEITVDTSDVIDDSDKDTGGGTPTGGGGVEQKVWVAQSSGYVTISKGTMAQEGQKAHALTKDGIEAYYVKAGGVWLPSGTFNASADEFGQLRSDLHTMSYKMVYMNTGGYTGAWGPEGRLAMLHQKELVLNADDTENMLKTVSFVRDLIQKIDIGASTLPMRPSFNLNTLGETGSTLEQRVAIEANFPNVQDRYEIEAAFNNLINTASQFANRKKL